MHLCSQHPGPRSAEHWARVPAHWSCCETEAPGERHPSRAPGSPAPSLLSESPHAGCSVMRLRQHVSCVVQPSVPLPWSGLSGWASHVTLKPCSGEASGTVTVSCGRGPSRHTRSLSSHVRGQTRTRLHGLVLGQREHTQGRPGSASRSYHGRKGDSETHAPPLPLGDKTGPPGSAPDGPEGQRGRPRTASGTLPAPAPGLTAQCPGPGRAGLWSPGAAPPTPCRSPCGPVRAGTRGRRRTGPRWARPRCRSDRAAGRRAAGLAGDGRERPHQLPRRPSRVRSPCGAPAPVSWGRSTWGQAGCPARGHRAGQQL